MAEIFEINEKRQDLPAQEFIRRIANAGYANARLGNVSAIAVVSIMNGGKSYAGAFAGITRQERMQLVGELDALRAAILAHDDENGFEKLPG